MISFIWIKKKILLRVVQVTRAQSHSYKLKYVVKLMEALQNVIVDIKDLDIVMVYPRSGNRPEIKKSDQQYYVNAIKQDKYRDFNTGVEWKEEHIRILMWIG